MSVGSQVPTGEHHLRPLPLTPLDPEWADWKNQVPTCGRNRRSPHGELSAPSPTDTTGPWACRMGASRPHTRGEPLALYAITLPDAERQQPEGNVPSWGTACAPATLAESTRTAEVKVGPPTFSERREGDGPPQLGARSLSTHTATQGFPIDHD